MAVTISVYFLFFVVCIVDWQTKTVHADVDGLDKFLNTKYLKIHYEHNVDILMPYTQASSKKHFSFSSWRIPFQLMKTEGKYKISGKFPGLVVNEWFELGKPFTWKDPDSGRTVEVVFEQDEEFKYVLVETQSWTNSKKEWGVGKRIHTYKKTITHYTFTDDCLTITTILNTEKYKPRSYCIFLACEVC